ncbi:MAG: methionyl-tRNA formyltransferase [Salibacteraceae bacterium]
MDKPLRIVFFGTPEFAVPCLESLAKSEHEVVAVVTAPDRQAGRGQKKQPSAVKVAAEKLNIHIHQPENLKDNGFIEALEKHKADMFWVVAFRMLPEQVWRMPPLGTYNVHASLLPQYRGAAPINWVIINGEKQTGLTTFKLKHEIDTGDILHQVVVDIEARETAKTLHDKLMNKAAVLILQSTREIASGRAKLTSQPTSEPIKKAPKIHKEDLWINWNQPAEKIDRFIRGLSPIPGAKTRMCIDGKPQQWKIIDAIPVPDFVNFGQVSVTDGQLLIGCNEGTLMLRRIKPEGRPEMNATDFLNGMRGKHIELCEGQSGF